jgi:outer membrane protein TolC
MTFLIQTLPQRFRWALGALFFASFRSINSETLRRKRNALLPLSLLAVLLSWGSPVLAERSLSLEEALTLARSNNRDLRVARAHLEGTATSVDLAWAALLPQVTAQGKYTHNYKDVSLNLGQLNQGVTGLAGTIAAASNNPAEAAALQQFQQALDAQTSRLRPAVIQKGDQLDFTATAVVPLVIPYAYDAIRAARLNQQSNAASFDVTDATVLLSVAQAYYAAAGADELVQARHHAIAVATDTFQTAKARVDAGFVNRVELTRAEVALVRAGQDEADAVNTRDAVYRSLGTLLGTHEPLRVQPKDVALVETASVQELVAGARRLRPEFALYRDAVLASEASERSQAWRWAPALSAFATGRQSNYAGFAGDRYFWAVGASLDWTLYDGGVRDAQRQLAAAQGRESAARLELLTDTVADEVVNAKGTLETKRKAVEAATRARDLSNDALTLVRAQYEAGTALQLDVLQAQDSLVSAEVGVVQARFDLSLAELQLKKSAGLFPPRESQP